MSDYMKKFVWSRGLDGVEEFKKFTEGTSEEYRPCDGLVWVNNYLSNIIENGILVDDSLRGDEARALCKFLVDGLLKSVSTD